MTILLYLMIGLCQKKLEYHKIGVSKCMYIFGVKFCIYTHTHTHILKLQN